ncbi:hypothetical protein Z517_03865 [Fonsecaea pedrosoi CBS 271.37]|uniref:Xylanolytic transcriptional activator regulatory domain-containing protein n=1 Tax=Fonsecaea pedrosoi CBS 271.37 TaxID=1442368 RepID=A0A0D2F2H5_9EURO|nr:uncharacterized protein Z517_03865 [Fonsecaea pedrosoi CBS 271.37]KIW80842.1 hypothetical protein Z517_03865 [Fonsecaea pedrosoi CBS 271.37]
MQREIDGLRRALQLAENAEELGDMPPGPPARSRLYHPTSIASSVVPQSDARLTPFFSSLNDPSAVTTIPEPDPRQVLTSNAPYNPAGHPPAFQYSYHPSPVAIASLIEPGAGIPAFSPPLDGLEIEPQKLDDCYSLYFSHYHSIIPILDPQQSCRECFQYSPLLFWTIIVTGSRRYSLDPTLLEVLAPKVSNLAALATTRISEYIPTITALLLLCVWPLPMENASDDPSPIYAGVITQLSQQNGLHMLSRRQDFSHNHLIRDTNSDIFLATLWAWCKLICSTVNTHCGLHHHVFEDAFDLEQQSKDVLDSLSRPVFWMLQFANMMSNANHTLMKGGYGEQDVERPYQLLAMIKFYDDEIIKLKRQTQGQLAEIYFTSARLHTGAYYFFILKQLPSNLSHLVEVHHVACAFIDNITSRDQKDDYALYLSEQFYRTLTLAAMVILRVCRSPELSSTIDYTLGEQSYFAAIRILKKRALKNNDLNARMAATLSQLWRSKRIFTRHDGSIDSLKVRIRTRGAMGVVYDCLWYWRQEFLGQSNPYSEENSGNHAQSQRPLVTNTQALSSAHQATTQLSDFDTSGGAHLGVDDDAFFSEWNWSTTAFLSTELSHDFGESAVSI